MQFDGYILMDTVVLVMVRVLLIAPHPLKMEQDGTTKA